MNGYQKSYKQEIEYLTKQTDVIEQVTGTNQYADAGYYDPAYVS